VNSSTEVNVVSLFCYQARNTRKLIFTKHPSCLSDLLEKFSAAESFNLDRPAGKDGIFAEHISVLIQVCAITWVVYTMCVQYMEEVHRNACKLFSPIGKNKNAVDISDAGNYRPVSLATIISKFFEHYILSCISPILATTDNQFGFKPNMAQTCVFFYLNRLCLIT